MNCLPKVDFKKDGLPPFSFVVARDESPTFHGSLSFHPACSPLVHVNTANKTALKMIFKGRGADEFVDAVQLKRKEPDGGFDSMERLEEFIKIQKLDVHIDEESMRFLTFSS